MSEFLGKEQNSYFQSQLEHEGVNVNATPFVCFWDDNKPAALQMEQLTCSNKILRNTIVNESISR